MYTNLMTELSVIMQPFSLADQYLRKRNAYGVSVWRSVHIVLECTVAYV